MKLYINYNIKDLFNNNQLITAITENEDVILENSIKIISKMKEPMDYVALLSLENGNDDQIQYFYDTTKDIENKQLTAVHFHGYNQRDEYKKAPKELKKILKDLFDAKDAQTQMQILDLHLPPNY